MRDSLADQETGVSRKDNMKITNQNGNKRMNATEFECNERPLVQTRSAKNQILEPPLLLRNIRTVYPHVSQPGKHAPYDGYDIAGAFLCFCRKTQAKEAPGWMRRPTAPDVADCLISLGWHRDAATDAALRLCQLCDRASPYQAAEFLAEILKRTGRIQAPAHLQVAA